ncbi:MULTISPECIES: 30S ribosomal protein S8 [unclassified Mycoplasma]|uniref:30S ribosomal protein S8 n=1 Tax=unclassified Mycoplasma TaxID=2683645 RepID=UPI000FDE19C8
MYGIITDPIGDMLIRIKNANQRKHKTVAIPYSKIKHQIVTILRDEGFITDYESRGEGVSKELVVGLKYRGDQRVIVGVKRISKPGLRVYAGYHKLPRVLSGYGTAIVSTSRGIVTDRQAREWKVGGEIIAYVW